MSQIAERISPLVRANIQVERYLNAKIMKQEANDEMNKALAELESLKPDIQRYFDGKTCKLEAGKVINKSTSSVLKPKKADIEAIKHKYPNLLKWEPKAGELAVLLNQKPVPAELKGFSIKTTEKLAVEAYKETD